MNSTIFKERPSGGYYCAECRMSFGELHTTCPYCGSFISNYEDLLIKEENDNMRPMFDIDETGRNKYATGGFVPYDEAPEIIIGGRWWEEPDPDQFQGLRMKTSCVDDFMDDELYHELLKKVTEYVKRKEKENEDKIH